MVSTSVFYERCRPLVERTLVTLEEAMQGWDWGAVAALYVVGGASALPLVGRLLRERYGRKVRTSPYPHAATAIGLAIAADQAAGYQLRERFTRHFGVWREAEAGRAVAFDVVFAKDSRLPAPGEGPLTSAPGSMSQRTTSGIFATSNAASSPPPASRRAISPRGMRCIFPLRGPCMRRTLGGNTHHASGGGGVDRGAVHLRCARYYHG